MKTVEINSIGWACDICDIFMEELSKHTGIEYVTESEDDPDTTVFTEEGQDIFDGLYDDVIDYIERGLGIDHADAGNGIILAHTEEYKSYDTSDDLPL